MGFRTTCQKLGYRPDIDGLRAIAVSTVVLYHAGISGFSGGFVGVDIFFVISGFLITGIVWSELGKGSFSLQDFYVRRIRRIFPALFAVLFFCSIAAFLLLTPHDLEAFGKSLNATVSFYSNFHWVKNTNYFDGPAIEKPLLHTWSLSVEEQFYAVWPLALLFLSRTVAARRIPYVVLGLAIRFLGVRRDQFVRPEKRCFLPAVVAGVGADAGRIACPYTADLAAGTAFRRLGRDGARHDCTGGRALQLIHTLSRHQRAFAMRWRSLADCVRRFKQPIFANSWR